MAAVAVAAPAVATAAAAAAAGAGAGGSAAAGLAREHGAALVLELADGLEGDFGAVDAIPEQALAVLHQLQAAGGLVEEPGQVLVVLGHGPDQLGAVVLDGGEDVVGDVAEPAGLGDGQGGQDGEGAVVGGREDDGQGVHLVVVVGAEGHVVEEADVRVDAAGGVGPVAVAQQGVLELVEAAEVGEALGDDDLSAAADEGAGARVGEQLLVQVLGVDDGDAGGARQGVEQLLDLLDLEAGAELAPRLGHVPVELLVEVDGGDLGAVAVEQAALLGQVDDLERLEGAGQLGGGHVGVDVEQLALGRHGERGQDGQVAVLDGVLDGGRVDLVDLADEAVLVAVEVVGAQGAEGHGAHADAVVAQLAVQLVVLLLEQLVGDAQRAGVGDADALLEVRLDAGVLEQPVELRAGAVHDHRAQADVVEEGQAGAQLVEVLREDGAADLDDGELLRRHRREQRQVLLRLALRPDRRQRLYHDAARAHLRLARQRGRGRVAPRRAQRRRRRPPARRRPQLRLQLSGEHPRPHAAPGTRPDGDSRCRQHGLPVTAGTDIPRGRAAQAPVAFVGRKGGWLTGGRTCCRARSSRRTADCAN